jgi:hypothetical protein
MHLVRLSDYNDHQITGSQRIAKQMMDVDRLTAAQEAGCVHPSFFPPVFLLDCGA